MDVDEIKKEALGYQQELECLIETDDINSLIDRAIKTASMHARIGYMLAESKMLLRKKKSGEISDMIIKIAKESCLSSKAQNALVDSIAIEENYVVDLCERLNSMCVHQMDLIRSIISKEKEEMKYQNYITKNE